MRLEHRFQIRGELGSGGFATVYRAFDVLLGQDVALKVLHPHVAAEPGERERFLREGAAMRRLRHPNIVTLLDSGADGEQVWHATELIEGRSLAEVVAAGGPLSNMAVSAIAVQMASALAALHARGLIHRDIKPANILIEQGSSRAVLLDLGVARDQRNLSRPGGVIVGTPAYMAPEQLLAGGEITTRTDVYQLGATLYTLLTGEPPFAGGPHTVLEAVRAREPRDPRSLRPALPEPVAAVLLRALAKLPSLRPDGPRELADSLTAALAGTVVAVPAGVLPSSHLLAAVHTDTDAPLPTGRAVSAVAGTDAEAGASPIAPTVSPAPALAHGAGAGGREERPGRLGTSADGAPPVLTGPASHSAEGAADPPLSPAAAADGGRPARVAQGGDTLCAPAAEVLARSAAAAVQPPHWAPASPWAAQPFSPLSNGNVHGPAVGPAAPRWSAYPAPGWQGQTARPAPATRNRWLAAIAGVAALAAVLFVVQSSDGARANVPPVAANPSVPGGPSPAPANPAPGGGTVLLRDDFNDPNKGALPKQSRTPNTVRMGYDNGEYVIDKHNPNAQGVFPLAVGAFDNATITIEARLTGDTRGRVVAVACRASAQGGYQLSLDPATGLVSLDRVDATSSTPLTRPMPAMKVNRGGKNQLSLTCAGNQIRARINGVEVARATDRTHAKGQSAFLVFSPGNDRATAAARWDNLLVEAAKP